MEYPVFCNGKQQGILHISHIDADTCFELTGNQAGLYRAWVEGEHGRLLLGIMENGRLRRRFSPHMTRTIGRPLCAQLECLAQVQAPWRSVRADEFIGWTLPEGAYCRTNGWWYELAVPYNETQSFPLLPLFCFAKVIIIENRQYLAFYFDSEWQPIMT